MLLFYSSNSDFFVYKMHKHLSVCIFFPFSFWMFERCCVQLEKDLQDIRFQMAEVKFTSEKKFADAQALETGLEEQYVEIEAKAHAADAKLAEVNRKSSEIDRKLDDLEALKRKLQKENMSLSSEQVSPLLIYLSVTDFSGGSFSLSNYL